MSLTPKQKKRLLKYVLRFLHQHLLQFVYCSVLYCRNECIVSDILYLLMITQDPSFNICYMFQQKVGEDGEEEEEEEEGEEEAARTE